jgi:Na+/H+ antiporter NhaA
MNAQTFAAMLTIFVLGLFVGSNLGVMLMCLLQVSGKSSPIDGELATVAVHAEK